MGYFTLVLVLLVVFSHDGLAKKRNHKHHNKSNGGKIVGGHDVTIQEYPYQAFMLLEKEKDDYYQCGGAIISPSYIVSASHCFPDVTSCTVRIGSTNKFEGGEQYPASFEMHPKYDHISKDYDIAIVKTNEEMTLDGTNAKAVSLVEKGTVIPSGSMIKLSGWGATSEGGDTPNTLMAVEVPTLSNEECNEKEKVTERQFCGGYKEGGKDTCQGDSGGPVVLADSGLLAGVVSAGYGCARPDSPGIYSNMSDLRDWVLEKTGV